MRLDEAIRLIGDVHIIAYKYARADARPMLVVSPQQYALLMNASAPDAVQRIAVEFERLLSARHQTPEADGGDHPGGDRADVARHDDEVTDE